MWGHPSSFKFATLKGFTFPDSYYLFRFMIFDEPYAAMDSVRDMEPTSDAHQRSSVVEGVIRI